MKSYFENLILQYKKIRERLMDEESARLFDARVEYAITGDWERVKKIFFIPEKDWRCAELESFLKKFPDRKDIVLFGASKVGKETKQYLEACGYNPACFCDNHAIENQVDGIPVISVDDFMENYKNAVIIICSLLYRKEMYCQLLEKGCCAKRILLPAGNRIQTHCGRQYFDMFTPGKRETFVDAGGFDGSTIEDFYVWLGEGKYGKCFSMEPVPEMYNRIVERKRKEGWQDVTVCNCAVWDKEEAVFLTKDQKENDVIWGGSCVGDTGDSKVCGKTIDEICMGEGEPVTFIKMDVEGSELKALKGAKNIITQQKPRLAISIYHKPLDVFEIPDYILSLVPEYKMYIRQYASDFTETVLYAEV